jgi:hypothetical protein
MPLQMTDHEWISEKIYLYFEAKCMYIDIKYFE